MGVILGHGIHGRPSIITAWMEYLSTQYFIRENVMAGWHIILSNKSQLNNTEKSNWFLIFCSKMEWVTLYVDWEKFRKLLQIFLVVSLRGISEKNGMWTSWVRNIHLKLRTHGTKCSFVLHFIRQCSFCFTAIHIYYPLFV